MDAILSMWAAGREASRLRIVQVHGVNPAAGWLQIGSLSLADTTREAAMIAAKDARTNESICFVVWATLAGSR